MKHIKWWRGGGSIQLQRSSFFFLSQHSITRGSVVMGGCQLGSWQVTVCTSRTKEEKAMHRGIQWYTVCGEVSDQFMNCCSYGTLDAGWLCFFTFWCHVKMLKEAESSPLPLGCCLQGWPQPIICLHLSLSSASFSLTPSNFMFSLTTSIDLPFVRAEGLLTASSNHSILPLTDSPYKSKPSHSGFTSKTSNILCLSVVLIGDPIQPLYTQGEAKQFILWYLQFCHQSSGLLTVNNTIFFTLDLLDALIWIILCIY